MITADERLVGSLAAIPSIAAHIQTVRAFSG
jgi:hypothetical protein